MSGVPRQSLGTLFNLVSPITFSLNHEFHTILRTVHATIHLQRSTMQKRRPLV